MNSSIALTVADSTRVAAEAARRVLEAAGLGVRLFAADGAGGRDIEARTRAGDFAGVLDLTPAQLAAEVAGTPDAAGRDRLTAAGMAGVPQVVSVGGLDAVRLDDGSSRRTTPEECDRVGLDLAQKACAARGPTAIVLPRRDPGDASGSALHASLRSWVYGVELLELDLPLDDPAFGRACGETLLRLLRVTNLSQSLLDS